MALVLPSAVSNPTTGQAILTAWGDAVNDAISYLGALRPRCVVSNNAAQSVNNATATDLTANTEAVDVGGMHSTVTNTARITVPSGEGGLYRVSATVSYAGDADGYRSLRFQLNGSSDVDVETIPAVTTQDIVLSGSRLLSLSATDYVTCRVTHTAGAALNCILLEFSAIWEAT